MPFDEEEIDTHGECAAEIGRLRTEVAHAAMEIDRVRAERDQYMKSAVDYGNMSERLRAILSLLKIAVDREGWPAGWGLIRKEVEAAMSMNFPSV